MPSASLSNEVDIWERIIRPDGPMSKDTARRISDLSFSKQDQARMQELAAKNRSGEISDDEESELDHYCRVGTLLSILKLRAKRTLKTRPRGK